MIGDLPDRIVSQKVIPVARRLDASSAPRLAEALGDGGLTVLEVTMERRNAVSAIEAIAGGELTVGAGTVTSIAQARDAVDAGASFLVAPHAAIDILDWARGRDVPMLPGAFTPSEIHAAWQRGAPAVKLFPASLGGPAYLRSLFGPYPELRLVPTGGVDAANARDYLDAGAIAVGVGAWLTGGDDYGVVTERAKELVGAIA